MGRNQFRMLAGGVVLLNLYAGGCVIHELGPLAAAMSLAATPSFVVDFLLGGLGIYIVAIGLVGMVALPHRLFAKRWLGGEAFLVSSTAATFFLVGIAGSGSA